MRGLLFCRSKHPRLTICSFRWAPSPSHELQPTAERSTASIGRGAMVTSSSPALSVRLQLRSFPLNIHRLTASPSDKSIKIWSIDPPNESSGGGAGIPSDTSQKTRLIDTPDRTIQTSAPVWRARFTPFGEGILSLPQAGETTLDLWKLGSQPGEEKVVKQFSGHTDKVKEVHAVCSGAFFTPPGG